MKRSYYLLMLALACLLMAAPSYAQSDVKVTFHTSFSFTAGTAVLPAGEYTITEGESGHALIFRAEGGHSAAILLTRIAGFALNKGRASVTFTQQGGRYYLDTINLLDGSIVRMH